MQYEQKRLEELENLISNYFNDLDKTAHWLYESQIVGEVHKERIRVSKFWTHEHLKELYNIICVYFETQGLTNYLTDFKLKYNPIIEDKELATAFTHFPIDIDDHELELALKYEWRDYLVPFNFLNVSKKETTQYKNLLAFLQNTNNILKFAKIVPQKEEDINKVIRETAKLFYKDVVPFSEGYFRHSFKQYHPDVIIRDLGVAIEYKLIKKQSEIGERFGSLVEDAAMYSGNSLNKNCIVVICLTKEVNVTNAEIIENWRKFKFPKDWDLIIIPDVEFQNK